MWGDRTMHVAHSEMGRKNAGRAVDEEETLSCYCYLAAELLSMSADRAGELMNRKMVWLGGTNCSLG